MAKNIKNIIIFIFVLIVVLFFYTWTLEPPGKDIFELAISQLPFIEFLYQIQQKVTDGSQYNGVYDTSKIIVDFIKLFLATPLYAFFRALLSKFLLNVPSGDIDSMEKYMSSPFYIAAEKSVEFLLSCGSIFVSAKIIALNSDQVKNFFSTNTGTFVGILTILVLFIVYSIIFAYISKQTISFAIIKTVAFNIIPQIINIYFTTAMYIMCYFMYQTYKLTFPFWLSFIILIAWCAVKDLFIKKVEVSAVKYRNYYNFKLSSVMSALYMFYGLNISTQAYCIQAIDYSMFDNDFVKMFFNFPAMPFFSMISNNIGVFETLKLTDNIFLSETLKLILLSMFSCVVSRFFSKFGATLSIKGIIKWSTLLILQEALVIMMYSFTLYITNESTFLLLVFFGAVWLLALVINILMDLLNTITDAGFFLSNMLLEGLITGFVCVIFIYFVEKAMYIAPSDMLLTDDYQLSAKLIITACITFVMLAGWFTSDMLNIQKKSQ